MDRRFDARLEGDVGSGGGGPRSDRRVSFAPGDVRPTVLGVAGRARTTATHGGVLDRTPLEARGTRPAKGSPICSIKNGKASRSSSGRSRGRITPCSRSLATQVGEDLGETDGVIVFDPSAFAKKGTKSVGVARQWCGRLGKVENCQVGIYMAYVSRKDHAIVNTRLYLPEEWTKDRARCKAAGVPKATKFRTRHELALEMLEEHGALLPHSWVAGDDEMGRPASFRQELSTRGERYLLAVPSNTLIRDLEATPPEYSGRGRHPLSPFVRVDRWCAAVAGFRLDNDRGPRRREGAAGGGGRQAACAGAYADGRHRSGGVAVPHAGASSGRNVQA